MDEISGAPVQKPTTVAQRFGGFAAAHITYSLLSLPCLIFGGMVPVWPVLIWLYPVAAMIFYFPIGMFTAWLSEWSPPQSGRERQLAVLLPALVAWIWVGIVLISVTGEWGELFMAIFAISFLFATPSSLFSIIFLGTFSHLTGDGGLAVSLGLCGLLAGFLPPLFFALGSFWQSERRKGRGSQAERNG